MKAHREGEAYRAAPDMIESLRAFAEQIPHLLSEQGPSAWLPFWIPPMRSSW